MILSPIFIKAEYFSFSQSNTLFLRFNHFIPLPLVVLKNIICLSLWYFGSYFDFRAAGLKTGVITNNWEYSSNEKIKECPFSPPFNILYFSFISTKFDIMLDQFNICCVEYYFLYIGLNFQLFEFHFVLFWIYNFASDFYIRCVSLTFCSYFVYFDSFHLKFWIYYFSLSPIVSKFRCFYRISESWPPKARWKDFWSLFKSTWSLCSRMYLYRRPRI